MTQFIMWQGKKYYYFDTYYSWRAAYNVARFYKRTYNSKYFIQKEAEGFAIPYTRYSLYMTNIKPMRLF